MIAHKLDTIKAVAATCEKDGNVEYYTCKTCGKYFSDKDGKKEITENSWVVKATGHQIVEEKAANEKGRWTAGKTLQKL